MPLARAGLWALSLAGLSLVAKAWFGDAPPLWLAIAAFAGYVAYSTLGVLVPQLEMYGDVTWRATPGRRRCALTFDDGPHPETTRRVLALLAERGAHATFFVIGRKVERCPDVVREIHEAGHELGVHGFEHQRWYAFMTPRSVQADVARTQAAVERACGVRPTWFRPPLGQVSPRTAAGAAARGVDLVAWSVRARDGLGGQDVDAVVSRIAAGLVDGAIVALHDAAERDDFVPASLAALPRVLELIARQGLTPVRLSELIEEPSGAP